MSKVTEKQLLKARTYREGLDKASRERYDGKLQLICGEDPYEMGKTCWSEKVELLPQITYPDIVNYLVFTPSPYTAEDLKCYKGLDAYNQFVCGWVRETVARTVDNKSLVKAKVIIMI